MVGDADTDVIAGRRAGTMTALLEHPLTAHRRVHPGAGTETEGEGLEVEGADGAEPDLRARDLLEFAGRLYPTAAAV
jgi:hypothetical protein